jgi:two-component system phosphate regulon response regulator PhoB
MLQHILVVEDEDDLQKVLAFNLRQAGYDVICAANGKIAFRALQEEKFDLILLDIMLPDMSGTDIARQLKGDRRTAHIPIIFLTAKGEEIDRVVGMELGADDYVVKPFSVRELMLRVKAVLRRNDTESESTERVEFGRLVVDRAAHRAWVDTVEIGFTALELRLLLMLYDCRGRVLNRDQLLDEVWGQHVDVTTRNVDTHVKRVREKMAAAGHYIETVRGVGYRFADSPTEPGRD